MKNKGISLIALIITIIVVIIVAGSIILNLQDTNVIDNTEQAVLLSDVKNFIVELDLYKMEKFMENNGDYYPSKLNANVTSVIYNENNLEGLTMYDIIPSMENKVAYVDFEVASGEFTYTGTDANVQNILAGIINISQSGLQLNEIATVNCCYGDEDSTNVSHDNPVIPKGFKAVNTTDASWDLMEYNKGLVIENEDGNQFVWVPVDGIYDRDLTYPSYYGATESNTIDDTLPSEVTSENYQITNYGGFYIARYESGKEGIDTLVVKQGQAPWTFINQPDSKVKAEELYNTDEVQSGLVTGKMWDTTMKWIDEVTEVSLTDCRSWGNYNDSIVPEGITFGSIKNTGSNEIWKVNNIYDLAGNVMEHTNEIYDESRSIIRGGVFSGSGIAILVTDRYNGSNYSTSYNTGFRIALYIL